MPNALIPADFWFAPKGMVRRHVRSALTVAALVVALLHVTGVVQWSALLSLDRVLFDARARWVAGQHHNDYANSGSTAQDQRIVIVDIDEKSLADKGQWPWPRSELARLSNYLLNEGGAAVLGYDVVFPEAEQRAGLEVLRTLTQQSQSASVLIAVRDLQRSLLRAVEGDNALEQAIANKPVVLGYYFTNEREGFQFGHLPTPLLRNEQLQQGLPRSLVWSGFGANLLPLNNAAAGAGFFNAITDADGLVRRLPVIAAFNGNVYESFALSLYRQLEGLSQVSLVYADNPAVVTQGRSGEPAAQLGQDARLLKALRLQSANGERTVDVALDSQAALTLDFKSIGGAQASHFQYVSASAVLTGRVAPAVFKDKVVLVGASAPGLQDLRVTPVNALYPGVEAHATVLASLMDQRPVISPPWTVAINVLMLLSLATVLLLWLPALRPLPSMLSVLAMMGVCVAVQLGFYAQLQWVIPVAGPVGFLALALSLQMLLSYVLERRTRKLAELFGSYLPDTLVDEMHASSQTYSLQADARDMTVMFVDMRDFTAMAECMTPAATQQLLNRVLTDLTLAVGGYRGTLDKYLGDGLMAFWGAPLLEPDHAYKAVACAMDMAERAQRNNALWRHGDQAFAAAGGAVSNEVIEQPTSPIKSIPPIRIGVGIGTGPMFVGDMGSAKRRSYTVLGDAVNLTSRIEALCKVYGVTIIASQETVAQVPQYVWLQLDIVTVRGRTQEVAIYTPVALHQDLSLAQRQELLVWSEFMSAWKSGDAELAKQCLVQLKQSTQGDSAYSELYALYAQRVHKRFGDPSQASVSVSSTLI